MKRILLGLVLISSIGNAEIIKQYNGKIVDNECIFDLNERGRIFRKELYKIKKNYKIIGISEDDYETKFWLKDKQGKKTTKTIRFCKI